jgi:serine/threonine protein kinase
VSNATPNTAASKAPNQAPSRHEPTAFGNYLLLRRLTRGPANSFLAVTEGRNNYQELCYLRQFSRSAHSNTSLNALKDFQKHLFPGLPEIFEAGQVESDCYWVFPYTSGRDIAWFLEHCQRHHAPIPLGIVLYLLQEVSGVLLECQTRMLLPPQIRSQDFLLSYEGKVLYLDSFPGRMPPDEDEWEELGPGHHAQDPHGLVAFCGKMLHEMLTGNKTFPNLPALPSLIEKVRIAEVPDSVAPFLFRALTKDEQHRFPNIAALHEEAQGLSKKLASSFKISRLTDFLAAHLDGEIVAEQRDAASLLSQNLAGLFRAVANVHNVEEKIPKTIDITTGSFGSGAIGSQLGSETPPDPLALIDQQVGGRYRVKKLLGIGGMGWVYKAEHVEIGKQLALKVLHRNLCSNPEVVTRFRREARSASMIGHPNIIEVTDFGSMPDGSVYCVMELLDGVDLSRLLSEEKIIAESRVIQIGIQMMKALEAAHTAGIIHRDMKPANVVLIEKDGNKDFVKILDFGIAKMTGLDEQQTSLTRPGMTMGTPQYMAPEQAAGKPLDARADIYAVGAILYEMLTGTPPFTGLSVMEVLTRKLTQPPPPFSSRNIKDGHPELEAIVLACLDRKADNRPQNCTIVAQRLQQVLDTLEDPEARKKRPSAANLQNTAEFELAPVPSIKPKGWALPFLGGVAAIAIAGVVGWTLGLLSFIKSPPPPPSLTVTTPSSFVLVLPSTQTNETQPSSTTAPVISVDAQDRIRVAATISTLIRSGDLTKPKEQNAYTLLKEALIQFPDDPEMLALKSTFIDTLITKTDKQIKKDQIKEAEDSLLILEEFGASEEQLQPLLDGLQDFSNSRLAKAEQRENDKKTARNKVLDLVKQGDKARLSRKYEDAKIYYEEALRLFPKYHIARLGLAQVSFEEGKYAEAVNQANKVIKASPSNVEALILLGDARYKSFNYKSAIEAYDKALSISPGSTAAKRGKAAAEKKPNIP